MKQLPAIIIGAQLAASVVLAMAAGAGYKNNFLLFSMVAISSHASLLGMWGGLSSWSGGWRLLIFGVGGVFLGTELRLASQLTQEESFFIAMAPIACQFVIQNLRLKKSRFSLLDGSVFALQSLRPQFSIFQMLTLTAIVASGIAVCQQASFPTGRAACISGIDDYMLDIITFMLCAIAVGWASSWLLFSMRWSWRHAFTILTAPVGIGLIPVLYRQGPEPWIFVVASLLQQAAIVSVLLPIRMQGYRFVARRLETEPDGSPLRQGYRR